MYIIYTIASCTPSRKNRRQPLFSQNVTQNWRLAVLIPVHNPLLFGFLGLRITPPLRLLLVILQVRIAILHLVFALKTRVSPAVLVRKTASRTARSGSPAGVN